MGSSDLNNEVAYQLLPFFRAYKDGRVERFFGTDFVPPSDDSVAGISSKDVVIAPETGVSARIFKPTSANPTQKLPLLVYIHGGAFCIGSPFCPTYHSFLTSLVAEANVVAVSVDYRLAPENPLPAAYEDTWTVLKWVGSHAERQGPDPWINDYADLERAFIAGDSAGANIAHNASIRAGSEGLAGLKLVGACLVHPDFASREGVVAGAWRFANPTTTGSDDPRINPSMDPRMPKALPWERLLVFLAEKDWLRPGGLFYYETVKESGWVGSVDVMDTPGEDHVFHLFNPTCEKAVHLLKRMASFISLQ